MSVKEFAQKNSVKLLYTTIILAILTAVFGCMAFRGNTINQRGSFERQGSMQRGNRDFYQNRQGSTFPEVQAPVSQVAPTENTNPTQPAQ